MKHRISTLIAGVVACSGGSPAQAVTPSPVTPEVEILSATEDCGGATVKALPGHGFALELASFTAETGPEDPLVHRFCLVRLRVDAPEYAVVLRDGFEVSGSATIAPGASGSMISIRYFGLGDRGSNYFKAFDPESGTSEISGASEGKPRLLAPGEEAEVSLLINVTARSAPKDPAKTSAIKITEIKVPKLVYAPETPPCDPCKGKGS